MEKGIPFGITSGPLEGPGDEKMKHVILLTFLLLAISSCRDTHPLAPNEQSASYAIYFLQDSALSTHQAAQMNIDQLVLSEKPWITDNDILFYDFSSHCIYLKKDKGQFFNKYSGMYFQFEPVLIDKPFVIIANNERCYVGSLHGAALSLSPAGPYMDELDVGYFPKDVMHISRGWNDTADVRNDTRIKDAFTALGLYHGGISVELISVSVIEKSDTSTVEYTFKITNVDQDNLYVIDPDKMGSESFHYYTNGIVFNGNNGLIQSTYKKTISPDPYYSWDINRFTEVKTNTSIERTVRLRGYPAIPVGVYSCSFTFSNPRMIEKEARAIAGGRIWLGSVSQSNRLTIEVRD